MTLIKFYKKSFLMCVKQKRTTKIKAYWHGHSQTANKAGYYSGANGF